MAIEWNTLSTPTPEGIEEEREAQFEEMSYTIGCNTCPEIITTVLLWRDFDIDRPALVADWQRILSEHNMTHYEAPQIGA